MRTVIIGCGFVGRELGRQLLADGHSVHVLGRTRPDLEGCTWSHADLARDCPELPKGTDAVFYLAQSPHYRDFPENAEHLFAVNALGPVRAAVQAVKAGCRFFFNASTGNVYASSFLPLKEDGALNRRNAYALSKIAAEEALALFSGHFNICNGRIFGVFGPRQTSMLPAFIRDSVRTGSPIRLAPGPAGDDGGISIAYIFSVDLGRRLVALAERSLAGSDVPLRLNLAGECGVPLREFALGVGRVIGRPPVFVEEETPREFNLTADLQLLSSLLPLPYTPLAEALELSYGTGRQSGPRQKAPLGPGEP